MKCAEGEHGFVLGKCLLSPFLARFFGKETAADWPKVFFFFFLSFVF